MSIGFCCQQPSVLALMCLQIIHLSAGSRTWVAFNITVQYADSFVKRSLPCRIQIKRPYPNAWRSQDSSSAWWIHSALYKSLHLSPSWKTDQPFLSPEWTSLSRLTLGVQTYILVVYRAGKITYLFSVVYWFEDVAVPPRRWPYYHTCWARQIEQDTG